jgi:hypothetical protein
MLPLVFICISLLSFICFYYGTGKHKRFLIVGSIWLILIGVVAYLHFFENTESTPPRFIIIPIGGITLSFYFYKIRQVDKINRRFLIALQVLRVPIELALYRLFFLKQIPMIMTFEGWNLDILSGLSAAIILGYEIISGKKTNPLLFRIWNIAGLALLINIVLIALLSAPLPIQQFAFDQPNVAVLRFPYIFLPAFIVPLVFLSHCIFLFSNTSVPKRKGDMDHFKL